jgi:hypothetical protein
VIGLNFEDEEKLKLRKELAQYQALLEVERDRVK